MSFSCDKRFVYCLLAPLFITIIQQEALAFAVFWRGLMYNQYIIFLAKRKNQLRDEDLKSRTARNDAIANFFVAKKKKIEVEIEEKYLIVEKLRLENTKLKLEVEKLGGNSSDIL